MLRDATVEDTPYLVQLVETLVAESPSLHEIPFSASKMHSYITDLIGAPHGILVVAERGGIIVGFIAGGVGELPFSYEKFAFDVGLFVKKEYRGGFTAARLIKCLERKARLLGAVECRPGVLTGFNIERTHKLYERLGYTHTGSAMVKRWA